MDERYCSQSFADPLQKNELGAEVVTEPSGRLSAPVRKPGRRFLSSALSGKRVAAVPRRGPPHSFLTPFRARAPQ